MTSHADPCTCGKCNAKQNRIVAFGAIRRAVNVARRHDNLVKQHHQIIREQVESGRFVDDDYLMDVESSAQGAWMQAQCAAAIRQAIREAL